MKNEVCCYLDSDLKMFIPYLRLEDTGNEGSESSLYRTLMIFSYYVILPFPKPVVKYDSFIKDVIQLERGMNFSAIRALRDEGSW